MNPTIIQAIGFVALGFVIVSFQNNKRSTLLALMLTSVSLLVDHFILLGAWTGKVIQNNQP